MDDYDPRILSSDRESFLEHTKFRHRLHRRQDPELARSISRVIEREASSPAEASRLQALVQQLMRDSNEAVSPEDVPAILAAMRSGEDPRDALRERAESRKARRTSQLMSPEQENDEVQADPGRVWRGERPRERFKSREDTVEEAIVQADLAPEEEQAVRNVLRELAVTGGPTQPGLVREVVRMVRNGQGSRSIVARYS